MNGEINYTLLMIVVAIAVGFWPFVLGAAAIWLVVGLLRFAYLYLTEKRRQRHATRRAV